MPAAGARAEAKKRGEKTYFTGEPCNNGHVTVRYVRGGACKACRAEQAKQRYSEGHRQSPESRSRANFNWNNSTRGYVAKQKWRAKDPKKAWAVCATSGAKQRAKKKNLPFDLDYTYVLSLMPDKCPIFGTSFVFVGGGYLNAESATIDKLDPSKGYVKGNIAIISMKANAIKSAYGSKDLYRVADWMHGIGL